MRGSVCACMRACMHATIAQRMQCNTHKHTCTGARTRTATRQEGSRGEGWNTKAVGSAVVDLTNIFLMPHKGQVANAFSKVLKDLNIH
jgi:hypothetical protein